MLSVIILAALIRLSLVVDSPLVPAGIFTGAAFVLGLLFGHPILAVALGGVINFGISFVFFWLLKKTEDQGMWWVVIILGVASFIGLGLLLRAIQ